MAEALYLVTKDVASRGKTYRDGITAVLLNTDDGKSDATIITEAIALVNGLMPQTSGEAAKLPAGYFDTVQKASDLATGPFATDQDGMVFTNILASQVT